MEGVCDLYPFESKTVGTATINKFEVDKKDAFGFNLYMYDSGLPPLQEGKFVRLYVDGVLMMSDTNMEKLTNIDFITNAKGHVMIAGLGLGLIIHNIRDKIISGVVKSITVYEKNKDVIDLVSPAFSDLPITYVCEDILTYKPPKNEKYDTIYFDIWSEIDYSKNLPEIKMLHNRWKYHKTSKDSYMDSWLKKFMQRRRDRDNRSLW